MISFPSSVPPTPIRVNVGCGAVWEADWINLDHQPTAPEIRHFDIRDRLPFADGSVDAVYASHLLEHLDGDEGVRFLRECLRVLTPGGVMRLVVPDLEALCRSYLQALAAVTSEPGSESELLYEWAVLELIDQHVRTVPGGAMARFLDRPEIADMPALLERMPLDFRRYLSTRGKPPPLGRLTQRLRGKRVRHVFAFACRQLRTARQGALLRAAKILFGFRFAESLRVALFLRTGEIHRMAFDRHSLRKMLLAQGFASVLLKGAQESDIPGFEATTLDWVDATPRKPGSLYIEAMKTKG